MTEPQESVLPRNNRNHQPNGSTQRLAPRLQTEDTIDGIIQTSLKIGDQTANGEMDVSQSRASLGHYSNALNGVKMKLGVLKAFDKLKPEILQMVSDVIGGESGERFRAAIAAQNSPRQIASDRKVDIGGDKPAQT